LFKAITTGVIIKFKKLFIAILELIPSTISTWANLLAIIAVITLTGLIEINVKPTIQIFRPTYIVQKEDLHKVLLESRYPLTDSLTNKIFGSKSTVIIDIPFEQASFLKSGETISDILRMTNSSEWFSYKDLTDGFEIFRSQVISYNPDSELKGVDNPNDESGITISCQDDLGPRQKRIQVMPFFTKYIKNNYGSNWFFLSTDSLLKIDYEFRSIDSNPPLFLSDALFRCRKVFSILSIENNEAFDVKDLQIRIYKKYSIFKDNRLKLEAWTIEESVLNYQNSMSEAISIRIPILHAHNDIQLIISSWHSQIKNEDVILTYEKLKSINETYVWFIVIFTFLLSAVCRFAIGFIGAIHKQNKVSNRH